MTRYRIPATGVVFDLPNDWSEITLGQWLQIVSVQPTAPLLPYLELLPFLEILVSNPAQLQDADAGSLAELYSSVSFIGNAPDLLKRKLPKRIAGIKPPKEINLCTIKQYNSVAEWVSELVEEGSEPTEQLWYIPLLAVYLYPGMTGKKLENLSDAMALERQIAELPAIEAVPLAGFFLRNSITLKPSGRLSSEKLFRLPPKNKWRSIVSRKWLSFLRTIRLIRSPIDDD